MRILLDAHVSGPRVGQRLTAAGHEVRALDQEAALEGLDDDDVLALAAAEGRILVTHNVRDFPAILREWSAAGREHAGVILVYGIDHRELDLIAGGIERCFELYPEAPTWPDLAVVVNRDLAARPPRRA